MALNFSHRPIFSPHLSEDNLVSPMCISNGFLVDGVTERNSDVYGMPWHINREVVDCLDFRDDTCDRGGSPDCVSRDVLDLLPPDPFGMDISTTFTAITGWLENLEVDYGGYGRDERVPIDENYEFFAGLNFIWNNAFRFPTFPLENKENFHGSDELGGFGLGVCSDERQAGGASYHTDSESPCVVDTIRTLGMEPETSRVQLEDLQEGNCVTSNADGLPHVALSVVFGYLDMRDLFVVEAVCKSLRSTIQGDPFFWTSIHIDEPLNDKLTDDILLRLTNKARGNLQCLSLVNCTKITDDGLKEVLLNNPKVTKLCVPGCTRLSIEGIISNLRAFKLIGKPGIKHISIGERYGVTLKHFEELKLLLDPDYLTKINSHEPQFYRGKKIFSCSDGRAIDMETCPKCKNPRLVYDCPVVDCKGKEDDTQRCRACTLCIARCVECGRCINDDKYEETFCLELCCLDCSEQLKEREREQQKECEVGSCILADAEESCSFSLHD